MIMATTTKPKYTAPTPTPHITVEKQLPRLTWQGYDSRHYSLMGTLHDMLGVQRNHGSTGEMYAFSALVHKYVGWASSIDGAGNLHVDNRTHKNSTTLFTSHTDTCHHNTGNEGNPVFLDTDPNGDMVWQAAPGLCLGADDGAGVALMCHMLANAVPGYYIFFRGEEKGGVGSSWLADHMPDLLRQFERAVAFDRAGYSDVITHQGRGRCCSDEFGAALAQALTPDDFSLAFVPDNTGIYTDTAEFIRLIPECTNVSVGYAQQHGDRERLNVSFLQQLADQLLTVQWETLPTVRDPKVKEPRYSSFVGRNTWAGLTRDSDDLDWSKWVTVPDTAGPPVSPSMDDLDTLNEVLADAIDKAARLGSRLSLIHTIAELLDPEDPEQYVRHMASHRLTEYHLDTAYQDLVLGNADAYTTAEYLFDACSTT